MHELFGFLGCLGLVVVIITIAEAIVDDGGMRALRRREAEEIRRNVAFMDPNSPQSRKLREEMDQFLSK